MEDTTPRKKTRSLSLPTDPVARMREMHDLEAPVVIPQEKAIQTESNIASKQEILQARNIASKQEIKKIMRNSLKAPYSEGGTKGPLVTLTTRLPAEINQRLEWASIVTGSKKQEVIAEALRFYFEKLAEEEV